MAVLVPVAALVAFNLKLRPGPPGPLALQQAVHVSASASGSLRLAFKLLLHTQPVAKRQIYLY